MKKKIAIIATALTVLALLTFTLVACNKNPNTVTAAFEIDGEDDITDFPLRRGVYFNYKVTELNKIDGVDATFKMDGGKAVITISNGKPHLDEVKEILYAEPILKIKTENSATAPSQFVGKGNIKGVALSADKSSIQIEFTSQGINAVNNYHSRQLYVYLGDEYIATMTSRVLLTSSSATVTVSVPSNSNPMYPQTLAAQLNVGAFGLKIKNTSIK
ncbi:MAG: hypothetical protein NC037_04540 [Bacteroides sp.]|nr:hypothetical protein [Bacillota bacterium]MCM1394025.1 hypothetical protein [[Eubacterium] siraeum]MCM1455780.1 hypothetical protein [Bacteroides sp.]